MRKTNLQFREKSALQERRGTLKIGEVSQVSSIGIEALRFYERSGILGKPARTASGYRLYDRSVIDRLAFIKRAQTLGFSLDEIRRIINESKSGECPCEEVREIVRRRLAELDERMRQMRIYRRELAATLVEWDKAEAIEGDICGLIEGADIAHPLSTGQKIVKRNNRK